MKKVMVYADGVLVDTVTVDDNYSAEDYKRDCEINGWEFAPCSEDSEIELVKVDE